MRLLVIVLALSFGMGGGSARAESPSFCSSERFLSGQQILLKNIKSWEIDEIPTSGFVFHKLGHEFDRTRRLNIVSGVEAFNFDQARTRLEYRGQAFVHLSIGYRNMEADWHALNALAINHLRFHSQEDLYALYGPSRRWKLNVMDRVRWVIHDQVMDTYEHAKPYLTPAEFAVLQNVNRLSDNSDVLALLSGNSGKEWYRQTNEELVNNLLMTIQISYYGRKDFSAPSLKGMLDEVGIHVDRADHGSDNLPFQYRLDPKLAPAFEQDFYRAFDPHTTCEFVRYDKWDRDLPRPLVRDFILRAFDLAIAHGQKTVVADADAISARWFMREYGFLPYAELPILNNTNTINKETLLYLRLDSERFHRVYAKLKDGSSDVHIR